MRQTKRRIGVRSFYDRTGIERHLEKMAAKGWMIERVDGFGWRYRRIEPQTLRFAVTYFPKASDFDPGPTEEQQVYHDMAERTGWHYAGSWAQMQFFYTDRPDAVPIETDPELELETIHAAMKKTFFPVYGILLAISVFYILKSLSKLSSDPIGLFSSMDISLSILGWPLLALMFLAEIVAYLLWRRRAQKAAACGEFVDTPNLHPFCCVISVVWLVGFILSLLNILTGSAPLLRLFLIAIILYMLLMLAVVQGVKQLLKNRKVSRGVNMAVTIAVDVAMGLILWVGLVFGVLRAADSGVFQQESTPDDLPLTLAALWGDELPEAIYTADWTQTTSPFVAVYDGKEWAYQTEEHVSTPTLEYTVTAVRVPALYDRCRAQLVDKKIEISYRQLDFAIHRIATPCDAAPWGADEAWQVAWENATPADQYLLNYGHTMVEISFSWTPTDEQKALVGETLGGMR